MQGDTGAEKEQGRAAVDYLKSLNESISLQEANRDAIAESAIAMGVLTGTLSKLDAAQLQAALHAKEYKDAIDSIDQAVANAQNLPDSLDKQATIVGLKNQRSQVGASYQIQSAQDQQGIASQQLGPATQQALGTMVNQWGNMTTSIVAVMTKAIDSFNDDIAKAITGHGSKADFGKTLSQAGEGLVKTGLQKGESAIMGAFGLGKPDGSRQNPFYTIAAAGMGASSSIGLSSPAAAQVGLQDLVPGGSFIQPFISALPHFAGGGDVTAGIRSLSARMVRSHSFRGRPGRIANHARWAGRRRTSLQCRCTWLDRSGGGPRGRHAGSSTPHRCLGADPTSRGEAEATGR